MFRLLIFLSVAAIVLADVALITQNTMLNDCKQVTSFVSINSSIFLTATRAWQRVRDYSLQALNISVPKPQPLFAPYLALSGGRIKTSTSNMFTISFYLTQAAADIQAADSTKMSYSVNFISGSSEASLGMQIGCDPSLCTTFGYATNDCSLNNYVGNNANCPPLIFSVNPVLGSPNVNLFEVGAPGVTLTSRNLYGITLKASSEANNLPDYAVISLLTFCQSNVGTTIDNYLTYEYTGYLKVHNSVQFFDPFSAALGAAALAVGTAALVQANRALERADKALNLIGELAVTVKELTTALAEVDRQARDRDNALSASINAMYQSLISDLANLQDDFITNSFYLSVNQNITHLSLQAIAAKTSDVLAALLADRLINQVTTAATADSINFDDPFAEAAWDQTANFVKGNPTYAGYTLGLPGFPTAQPNYYTSTKYAFPNNAGGLTIAYVFPACRPTLFSSFGVAVVPSNYVHTENGAEQVLPRTPGTVGSCICQRANCSVKETGKLFVAVPHETSDKLNPLQAIQLNAKIVYTNGVTLEDCVTLLTGAEPLSVYTPTKWGWTNAMMELGPWSSYSPTGRIVANAMDITEFAECAFVVSSYGSNFTWDCMGGSYISNVAIIVQSTALPCKITHNGVDVPLVCGLYGSSSFIATDFVILDDMTTGFNAMRTIPSLQLLPPHKALELSEKKFIGLFKANETLNTELNRIQQRLSEIVSNTNDDDDDSDGCTITNFSSCSGLSTFGYLFLWIVTGGVLLGLVFVCVKNSKQKGVPTAVLMMALIFCACPANCSTMIVLNTTEPPGANNITTPTLINSNHSEVTKELCGCTVWTVGDACCETNDMISVLFELIAFIVGLSLLFTYVVVRPIKKFLAFRERILCEYRKKNDIPKPSGSTTLKAASRLLPLVAFCAMIPSSAATRFTDTCNLITRTECDNYQSTSINLLLISVTGAAPGIVASLLGVFLVVIARSRNITRAMIPFLVSLMALGADAQLIDSAMGANCQLTNMTECSSLSQLFLISLWIVIALGFTWLATITVRLLYCAASCRPWCAPARNNREFLDDFLNK